MDARIALPSPPQTPPTAPAAPAAPAPPPPQIAPAPQVTNPQTFPADNYVAENTASVPDPLHRAVKEVNVSIASYSRHMNIHFHEATGRRVVTVYDSETNEAIREIPPERVLDAHASMMELAGLFVDKRG